MNLFEMAEKVDSKESFLQFVATLAEDAANAKEAPERTADGKINLSPDGWENFSIEAFLGAIQRWGASNSSISDMPMVSEQASWQAFALLLHAGKFYE
jgi:hypothetical protein